MAYQEEHETEEERQQLAWYMDLWGLTRDAQGYSCARWWSDRLAQETYYGTTLWAFVTKGQRSGASLLFESQGVSTRRQNQQSWNFQRNDFTDVEPYWYDFLVYVYPGVQVMNIYGLTGGIGRRTHQQHGHCLGTVREFFDEYLPDGWRGKYGLQIRGAALSGLRMAIFECIAPAHVELFHGLSMLRVCGLDLYFRQVSRGEVDEQGEVTWYVQNSSRPVHERRSPSAGDWWWYPDLESVGQRDIYLEQYVDFTGQVAIAGGRARLGCFMQEALQAVGRLFIPGPVPPACTGPFGPCGPPGPSAGRGGPVLPSSPLPSAMSIPRLLPAPSLPPPPCIEASGPFGQLIEEIYCIVSFLYSEVTGQSKDDVLRRGARSDLSARVREYVLLRGDLERLDGTMRARSYMADTPHVYLRVWAELFAGLCHELKHGTPRL